MLGKLFKSPSVSPLNHSYDDSYTRDILYGVSSQSLRTSSSNPRLFRLIVAQDNGVGGRKCTYDSADSADSSRPINGTRSGSFITSRLHHPINLLLDYVFGCGVPTHDRAHVTKLHQLPVFNSSVGPYRAVLITRLMGDDDDSNSDDRWAVRPTYPAGSRTKSPGRVAVAVVIPLEHDNMEVITSLWPEICHYFVMLQREVNEAMESGSLGCGPGSGPGSMGSMGSTGPRSLGPSSSIPSSTPSSIPSSTAPPSDHSRPHILETYLVKLIRLIHCAETPRLMDSNSIMQRSLKTSDPTEVSPVVLNWLVEIFNWLEFKDGHALAMEVTRDAPRESSQFLCSLIALLIPLRRSLSQWYHEATDPKVITRVVILTGNPVVAKKLVFILNGLIGVGTAVDPVPEVGPGSSGPHSGPNSGPETSGPTDLGPGPHHWTSRGPLKSPGPGPGPSPGSGSNTPPGPLPIPIARPWQPGKSSAVALTSATSIFSWDESPIAPESPNDAAVPIRTPGTMRRTSSMAYLSSSLTSSLNSSSSSYSLSKLGGSFVDKWKHSFDSNEYFPNSVTKKMSKHSLRTPSPAASSTEDEFPWSNLPRPQDFHGLHPQSIPEIHRTTTAVVSEAPESIPTTITDKTTTIMNSSPSFTQSGNTLIIDQPELITTPQSHQLLPCVAFTEEFRPELKLQSCANHPRLEQQILGAMKSDLLFFTNNSKINKVISKTIFVNLRGKEVKSMEMRSESSGYSTRGRKVFSGSKNNVDSRRVEEVERTLKEIRRGMKEGRGVGGGVMKLLSGEI